MTDLDIDLKLKRHFRDIAAHSDIQKCVSRIEGTRGQLREMEIDVRSWPDTQSLPRDLQEKLGRIGREVSIEIEKLDSLIFEHDPELGDMPKRLPGNWSYEWCVCAELRGTRIPVLRGELEPVRRVILARTLSENVVLFFLSIQGERDKLVRENHNMGYHYHYLDAKGRRSDTLLTFEPKCVGQGQKKVRALSWERHAEKKAKFNARPRRWGWDKRKSVHEACDEHSEKLSLSDFKKPGKHAERVWPL